VGAEVAEYFGESDGAPAESAGAPIIVRIGAAINHADAALTRFPEDPIRGFTRVGESGPRSGGLLARAAKYRPSILGWFKILDLQDPRVEEQSKNARPLSLKEDLCRWPEHNALRGPPPEQL
jgi:hypothetical protein